jgi:hypothetical protein
MAKKDETTDLSHAPNLAKDLDEETLKEIGRTVVEDYKIDLGSRAVLDARMKEWAKLFSGLADPKNHPFEYSSNVVLPILGIASHQSHARSYDALIPSKEIAKCVSTDGRTVNIAARRQTFLNWQLTKKMKEWKKDMDKMQLILPIYGTGIKKTYYDHVLKRPVSRTLRIDEFVAPYGVKNLDDAPRKTHVIDYYTINDIKIRGKQGIWVNTEDITKENTTIIVDGPAASHKNKLDEATGLVPDTSVKGNNPVLLEQHRLWDMDGDGIEEPYQITVEQTTEKVLSIQKLKYFDQAGNEKVYNAFTAYNLIPSPDSWMGLGFGHILEHITRAINSITNQLIDAGTLSNTIGGLINKTRNLKIGKLKIKMGSFNEVDFSSDDIRKSIYEFQFKPPSAVLYQLLVMLQDYAQKVSVPDIMTGQFPPSDTTATTILTIFEEGMKVQSTIHRRQHSSLGEELEKISILNSLYIDEDEYKLVQNSTGQETQEVFSGREDFHQDIDTIPVSDPNIMSRVEKYIKAKSAYELLIQDPDTTPEEKYELKKNLLKAMEIQDVDKILKRPEPPPAPPDLTPEQEEAEFLAERGVQPLPEQDHQAHLLSHRIFQDIMADQPKDGELELSPQGKKLLEAHIRETMSLRYLQQYGDTNGLFSGENRTGNAGMVAEPVHPGIPSDLGVGETELAGGNLA